MRRLSQLLTRVGMTLGHNPLGHWFYETGGALELWCDEHP
jgi:hypothetical protein